MREMEYTLEDHFAGKPAQARELCQRIIGLPGTFGPVLAEPEKTCIHLVRRTALEGDDRLV